MSNKKILLASMIIAGSTLFGCQNNVVEEVQQEEQTKEEVQQDEQQMTEEERQAHIDEIRKSINGDQEEMTTEEYFEQQRKEKSQEIIASAERNREVNDIVTGAKTEEQQEKPREKTYLEIVSEIREEEIKKGLTYENFLLVGTVDFNSLYAVNQLFGEGELIGERGNIQQYRWTSGSGSNYKVVQIMFVDGMVESKSQSGLK